MEDILEHSGYNATHSLLGSSHPIELCLTKHSSLDDSRFPSVEETVTTKVELKPLTSTLKYEFIGPDSIYPVTVNVDLSSVKTEKLLELLRLYKRIIMYTIDDIKGLDPSFCMHNINLEDDCEPSIEHQMRLIPNMKEVLKKKVLKLLDARIIYLIADNEW